METAAKKSIPDLPPSNFYGNHKDGGYSGFYWKYDLVQAVKRLVEKKGVKGLNFGSIEAILKKFSSAVRCSWDSNSEEHIISVRNSRFHCVGNFLSKFNRLFNQGNIRFGGPAIVDHRHFTSGFG